MNNFSGLIYRIRWSYLPLLLLGIALVMLDRPWKRGLKLSFWIGVSLILFETICIIAIVIRIMNPVVDSYEGAFVREYRDSRVAPPLPFTDAYVFDNGVEKKSTFYLDVFSKEKVFDCELIDGGYYYVFYDRLTKVIVRIEPIINTG